MARQAAPTVRLASLQAAARAYNRAMQVLRWGAVAGALFGACAVVASAMAAHAWSQRLDPAQMAQLQRALQFLCVHALALLVLAPLGVHGRPRWLGAAALLYVAGTILFCGSLAGAALAGWSTRLAPVGGFALIAAWLCTAIGMWPRMR